MLEERTGDRGTGGPGDGAGRTWTGLDGLGRTWNGSGWGKAGKLEGVGKLLPAKNYFYSCSQAVNSVETVCKQAVLRL